MSRLRKFAVAAALGSAACLLAGCFFGGNSPPPGVTCPKVMQAPDANSIVLFGPSGHDAKDVVVAGRIRDVDSRCQPEKVGLAVDLGISVEAQRANPGITDATLPYFVALVDADQHILKEDGFKVRIPFLPGEAYRRVPEENITVHVPVKDTSTGGAYTVVIGFQLTPDQIAFNRAAHPQQ